MQYRPTISSHALAGPFNSTATVADDETTSAPRSFFQGKVTAERSRPMSNKAQILIVNPEPHALALLGSMLQSLGHSILEAPNDSAAAKKIEREPVDLVIGWIDPEDGDALELLNYLRRKHPDLPVLLVFSRVHAERTREALRMGATAVLRYPLPATELRAVVIQSLESRRPIAPVVTPYTPNFTVSPNSYGHSSSYAANLSTPRLIPAPQPVVAPVAPETRISPEPGPAPCSKVAMIGEDPCLKHAIEMITAIAPRSTPVLIEGERGTGKGLLAQILHQNSPNHRQAFIEVSCGKLGDAMLERELFGHRASSSIDPNAIRPGALALANGGTIYLDDVAALSSGMQAQLLRVMSDNEYQPVGSAQILKCQVRFILSTREDLSSLVEEGRLRADLYYRIAVVRLKLPPLRHRGGDVERLARHFTLKFAREFDKPILDLTPDALDLLRKHDWPGNVEELESAIQRGVALCQSTRVSAADLVHCLGQDRHATGKSQAIPSRSHLTLGLRPLKEALEEPEKQIIIQALQSLNWNRQETARVLDINRTTLYKKMKKYGLLVDEPAWVE